MRLTVLDFVLVKGFGCNELNWLRGVALTDLLLSYHAAWRSLEEPGRIFARTAVPEREIVSLAAP
jgi:hypothetical protein